MESRMERSETTKPKNGMSDIGGSNRRLEYVPLERISPNERNARKHSKRQIRQIADSYRTFGVINPIIVGPDFQIVAGHGRYAAAVSLGLKSIGVILVDDLSPNQLRAYAIADNKLGDLSSFDETLLLSEVEAIIADEPTLDITVTGFATAEIDVMIGAARTAQFNDLNDPIPDPPARPITREGDIYQLGPNRMICGDSTKGEVISRLIGDDKVSLVLSDVPYNLKIEGVASGLGRKRHRDFAMATGEMTYEQYQAFLSSSITACSGHLVDGSLLLLFIDWRHVGEMLAAGRGAGLELKNILVWAKDNAGMGSLWRSQHELIVAFKQGNAPHVNNISLGVHGRHRSNVLQYPGMNSPTRGRAKALEMHATVKPVALIADLMLDVTNRNDVVLDPFGGSGTAIIAAHKTGRRAYLAEIDAGFVDVAVRRWNALGGEPARLASTGQTFEELAEEREGRGL